MDSTKIENSLDGFYMSDATKSEVIISNTQISRSMHGIYVSFSTDSTLSIINCSASNSTYGMYISTNNVKIVGSNFSDNSVGIESIRSAAIQVVNSTIKSNKYGMVISAPEIRELSTGDKMISIQKCIYSFNKLLGLALMNVHNYVDIQDSFFYRNTESSISAYQSTFKLMGETVFRDNTAERGGGLALYNSTVTFGPGSNTQFINNTALEYGGAIYVVSPNDLRPEAQKNLESLALPIGGGLQCSRQRCFFRFHSSNKKWNNAQVTFNGNTANFGGLDIYGPTLYTADCSLNTSRFNFETAQSSLLQVSSEPSRVCFCVDNIPECLDTNLLVLNEKRYPGEHFAISVALTGYNFGLVSGSVYTSVVDQDFSKVISTAQHYQRVNYLNCTTLDYSISPQDTTTSIVLTLSAHDLNTLSEEEVQANLKDANSSTCKDENLPCNTLLTTPVYINVTLEACPLGFTLNYLGLCTCDQILDKIPTDDGIPLTCEIRDRTGYISRKGTVWIGTDTREKNTNRYYWHSNCPRDFCNSSKIDVDPRYPDVQCSASRGGLLCGSCQNGSSLQLGSNNCAQCESDTLALLIVFAILGILLVLLVKTLDLTVANGTVNGLIFYANVVWINSPVLFRFRDKLRIGYYIITVPIAWINLDFGVETCFGTLDQLTKSEIQFVFPVYIWCIAGFIILISHYSTRATKLFGSNSVTVLATLFLLSYGKLFRNITDILTYADINDSKSTNRKVWSLDGTVEYNSPGHIILIVVALLFFLIFILPFTVLLLTMPFLSAKSAHPLFGWINQLTPFFDAYRGPFKHQKMYQLWTGLLLLARVVILITIVAVPADNSFANILLITIVATLLLAYAAIVGLLYKKVFTSLLEISFLINLLLLSGAFLFCYTPPRTIKPNEDQHNPVVEISVIVALLHLVGILMFHIVCRILSIKRFRGCLKKKEKPAIEEINEPTIKVIDANKFYDSSRFHESLLM